jgi:hypothetical protein
VFLTLALLVSCQGPGRVEDVALQRPAVQLRWQDGLPLVPATVNGHPGWFLLDTGSGDFTVVDQALSQRLQLRHEPVLQGGQQFLTVRAEVPNLTAAGLTREHGLVYVDDLAKRPRLAAVAPDGVLGTGFFKGESLEIDFARSRLRVAPAVGADRRHVLDLRWGPAGTLTCRVEIGGQSVTALLDTGSRRSLLSPRLAAQLGGAGQSEVTLEEIVVAGHPLSAKVLQVAEGGLPQADLLLACDLLQDFRLHLNLVAEPSGYLVAEARE